MCMLHTHMPHMHMLHMHQVLMTCSSFTSASASNQAAIAKLGGIPPLITWLGTFALAPQAQAAQAVLSLVTNNSMTQSLFAKADGIPGLIQLVRSHTYTYTYMHIHMRTCAHAHPGLVRSPTYTYTYMHIHMRTCTCTSRGLIQLVRSESSLHLAADCMLNYLDCPLTHLLAYLPD